MLFLTACGSLYVKPYVSYYYLNPSDTDKVDRLLVKKTISSENLELWLDDFFRKENFHKSIKPNQMQSFGTHLVHVKSPNLEQLRDKEPVRVQPLQNAVVYRMRKADWSEGDNQSFFLECEIGKYYGISGFMESKDPKDISAFLKRWKRLKAHLASKAKGAEVLYADVDGNHVKLRASDPHNIHWKWSNQIQYLLTDNWSILIAREFVSI